MDIERMTGTDRHTLALEAGDVLAIQFETLKGSLYLEIRAPDDTVLYAGNGKAATEFTLNIHEAGVYTIAVDARRARGSIHIRAKDAAP